MPSATKNDPSSAAREIFDAGLAAADPTLVTSRALERLSLGLNLAQAKPGSIKCVAFGKAACAMADALNEQDDFDWHKPGIAVTNQENVCQVFGFEVLAASHPLPSKAGQEAAEKIAATARDCREDELLLVLVSGGGSAILPLPCDTISLENKIFTTDLLMGAGADIYELNKVRKHMSRLKGGSLAQLAYPARIEALILSDVVGDDPSIIASGPTVADASTFQDAVAILRKYDLWFQIPESVREHFMQGLAGKIPETPKPAADCFQKSNFEIIGSNPISLAAMQAKAEELGYVTFSERDLTGFARDAAEFLLNKAVVLKQANPDKPIALVAGGETTVQVLGDGKGGRNQEFALAFALAAENVLQGSWTLLSAGSDGIDGPTDAAGGILNEGSLARMRRNNTDPKKHLDNNDAYHALQAAGDLFITNATGTNVADLCVLLIP